MNKRPGYSTIKSPTPEQIASLQAQKRFGDLSSVRIEKNSKHQVVAVHYRRAVKKQPALGPRGSADGRSAPGVFTLADAEAAYASFVEAIDHGAGPVRRPDYSTEEIDPEASAAPMRRTAAPLPLHPADYVLLSLIVLAGAVIGAITSLLTR